MDDVCVSVHLELTNIFLYCQDLLIRYTLDVIHCEQNFAKIIVKTVTEHNNMVKIRRDLQRRGIKRHLWLIPHPKTNGKILKPTAPYVLTTKKFEVFSSIIENLKIPSCYISNMAQYIHKRKYRNLNSHDYYVLM